MAEHNNNNKYDVVDKQINNTDKMHISESNNAIQSKQISLASTFPPRSQQ